MGVRPPPTSDDEEPDTVAFGIAALDTRLENADIAFPASKAEIRRELGDANIPYDASGNTVKFEIVLDAVSRDRFESRQELLNTLHPIFEQRRRASGSDFLSQVRSMLPF